MRGMSCLIFSEKFNTISKAIEQIRVMIKMFKCEGIFLSTLLDTWFSPASRDVFTVSLSLPLQKLWPIIFSAPKFWRLWDFKVKTVTQ